MKLRFLGAAGTVTGSRTLLEHGKTSVLVDCGLFQGYKVLRERNWAPFPAAPSKIGAVVLTHAHIDHSGYLPVLIRDGFRGPVFCTPATADLCRIMLKDSAALQEEDAERANRRRYTKHKPARPLYTMRDTERALERLEPVAAHTTFLPAPGIDMTFSRAGHILGAASPLARWEGGSVLFSGDLGRPGDSVMRAPEPPPQADWLVLESTYGDRTHGESDSIALLGRAIARAARRGGIVMIASFAVGRAQSLLWAIHRLKADKKIPRALPVYLNSPMATDVTDLYRRHHQEHRLSADETEAMARAAEIVNSAEDSKALNRRKGPMVIIAGSGMATGGRIVHHIRAFGSDPRNTIVLAGFQAGGTRGAALLGGAKTLRMFGEDVPIGAEIVNLDNLSAHADADEIMAWLKPWRRAPRGVFVTHGEPAAADALRARLQHERGWEARVPDHLSTFDLTGSK
jgi:metallo-beta-lactamase family protein